MDRRRFLLTWVAGALATPFVAEAQQAAKVPVIGVLAHGSRPGSRGTSFPHFEAFQRVLRELGYVEGRTIAFDVRWDDGKPDQYAMLAADLVRVGVDIILAGTTPATLAAKDVTRTIPIVMAASGYDPVQLGLVASLARPGGNVTGMSLQTHELPGKRLELLRAAAPGTTRIALLWNPSFASPALVKEHEVAAQSLGVRLQPLEVRAQDDLEGVFRVASRARAQALMMTQGAFFTSHRKAIAELALRNRLPTISGETGYAQAGGLMDYGPNIVESWGRAALFVDKILKGTRAGDIPIEQPTKFELVINLKTAKALGLTIPPSLLARADQVIE
jgi:putative ABC transport system substrate-binding protein